MKVLYLTNIHNPYRDEFFEQLGQQCDLTVLFEQRSDDVRDASWFENAHAHSYKEVFLSEGERGPISKTMLRMLGGGSFVVVGCYNTSRQMAAISYMKRHGISFVVNSDGAVFDTGSAAKRCIRKCVLRNANAYLIAGKTCVAGLRRVVGRKAPVSSYPLSSLSKACCAEMVSSAAERDPKLILVVGQYEDYKGLDVALDAVKLLPRDLRFRFVGAGKKTDQLVAAANARGLGNVEVIPFMAPNELAKEYLRAGLFVLPSRQECWGLVVNEAAACGCPIVSTWGAGAAVEFVSSEYPQFLSEPNSADSLALTISAFLKRPDGEKAEYSAFLQTKAASYTIEDMVDAHMKLFMELAS